MARFWPANCIFKGVTHRPEDFEVKEQPLLWQTLTTSKSGHDSLPYFLNSCTWRFHRLTPICLRPEFLTRSGLWSWSCTLSRTSRHTLISRISRLKTFDVSRRSPH